MSEQIYPSFGNLQNGSPFMIYFNTDSTKISVEPLSILYNSTSSSEGEQKISSLGEELIFTQEATNYAYLECNIVTDNLTISTAKITISTTELPLSESQGTGKNFKLNKIRTLFGIFGVNTINGIRYKNIFSLKNYHYRTQIVQYDNGFPIGITLVPMYI